MLWSIHGKLVRKGEQDAAIETGGVAFRFAATAETLSRLPGVGEEARVFVYLYVRENALELYGFGSESERWLFERLNAVSGIGPKTALAILGIAKAEQVAAAINEGKTELLTRASGIGKRTAERIVLELKGKLGPAAPHALTLMESDAELEETLVGLGMSRADAKTRIAELDPALTVFKDRLKAALKRNH